MKYFFPIHLDGGNRGCEGIAKGTAILIGEPKENLIGLCSNIKLDTRLSIDRYVSLQPYLKHTLIKRIINKVCKTFLLPNPITPIDQNERFVSMFTSEDVLVSTGGDMMCYGNNQVITTNEQAVNQGCKTILWGCSMGPENLTPEKEATLRKFSLIYARESLTYDFFKSLGLKNVVCLPDPAFVLQPEPCELPDCFKEEKVIGLNLSNYTVGADSLETTFGNEVKKLIDYILLETDYHILIIPHVLWNGQDDRILSKAIVDTYYKFKNRFSILDSENLNYLQIRYAISKCYAFIGGRTHAVVSAYSVCVPAIALGYSIKSKGIAMDLGLTEDLVVDTKKPVPNALLNAFKYVIVNYKILRNHLECTMPKYKEKSFEIKQVLKNII